MDFVADADGWRLKVALVFRATRGICTKPMRWFEGIISVLCQLPYMRCLVHNKTRQSRLHTVKMCYSRYSICTLVHTWPWLWPLTLKTFSSIFTHMVTNCCKFHFLKISPLSTEISRYAKEVLTEDGRTDGRTDSRTAGKHNASAA